MLVSKPYLFFSPKLIWIKYFCEKESDEKASPGMLLRVAKFRSRKKSHPEGLKSGPLQVGDIWQICKYMYSNIRQSCKSQVYYVWNSIKLILSTQMMINFPVFQLAATSQSHNSEQEEHIEISFGETGS